MRAAICFLLLCFATDSTFAQSAAPPNTIPLPPSSPLAQSPPSSGAKTPDQIKEIEDRVSYWRTTCLKDWDAATHMTRKEWRTTCERVATERRKFLLEAPPDILPDTSRLLYRGRPR